MRGEKPTPRRVEASCYNGGKTTSRMPHKGRRMYDDDELLNFARRINDLNSDGSTHETVRLTGLVTVNGDSLDCDFDDDIVGVEKNLEELCSSLENLVGTEGGKQSVYQLVILPLTKGYYPQLDVKGCQDVYASFDKYVKVERLEGDNRYHAETHGLQVSFSAAGTKVTTVGESSLQLLTDTTAGKKFMLDREEIKDITEKR
ncbi:hypothetical protein Tco_1456814 [Tanacetum coccineum]